MPQQVPIVIIGAGPYGLSIAAHLRAYGAAFRIFGSPMSFWRDAMPAGMLLKSEGFASSLNDPGGFTLRRYCSEHGLPYADMGLPVPLQVIIDYGMAFQRRLVPNLEQKQVVALDRANSHFLLKLDDGESVETASVVVATGIQHFGHMPPELATLPAELATHSSAHHDLSRFNGKDVAVLGGGASAIDLAGLLHGAGARVSLLIRGPTLNIHTKMRLPRPLGERIRAPMSGIGPGWRSLLWTDFPQIFRLLPERLRLRVVARTVPPAAGWFMREYIDGKVDVRTHRRLVEATVKDGRVKLVLGLPDGGREAVSADHVIAGTGFRPDVRRLPFLNPALVEGIATVGNMPVLSSRFESTVPGLSFVGGISMNSFGPVARFIVGSAFTAPTVARHLARSSSAHRSTGAPAFEGAR